MKNTPALVNKSIEKQKMLMRITLLLQHHGSLRAIEIVDLIDGLSRTAINRYLSELTLNGNIRKVRAKDGARNMRAYQFHSEYGSNTDILSVALSHPLHQITLSISGKINLK